MRACKLDKNHNTIASMIESVRLVWIDTSWSRGRLLDGIAQNPINRAAVFIEIKNGPKDKLTESEEQFIKKHLGRCMVIWSWEQVQELRRMI
jgi:hypothetical protein